MRKKILFLSAFSAIGGAERVLLTIVEQLVRDGYRPFLIAQDFGPLSQAFLKLGGRVFIFKLPAWRKFRNILWRWIAVHRIARIVRKEGIDLIYANGYRLNPYAVHVSRLCKIKPIVHVHDCIEQKYVPSFLLDQSLNIIVPSFYIRSRFQVMNARIFVLPNGIDVDKFSDIQRGAIRQEFHIAPDTVLVTMAAHFKKDKRHHLFIEAALRVVGAGRNVKFMVVGDNIYDGPLSMQAMKERFRHENIESRVIFTGRRDDVSEIFVDSDIFILPSIKEPFGLVVIEAMAARLPVIVDAASGGPAEIIGDGGCGLCIDCSDVESLAKAIERLIDDRPLRDRMAEAGYQKVRDCYDIFAFQKNLKAVFDEICGYSV